MNKQDKIIRASVIEQPLEGLLYDLDLMPEQCRSTTANMKRIAIEELRKEIERLREENEWLLDKTLEFIPCIKKELIKMMQQELLKKKEKIKEKT